MLREGGRLPCRLEQRSRMGAHQAPRRAASFQTAFIKVAGSPSRQAIPFHALHCADGSQELDERSSLALSRAGAESVTTDPLPPGSEPILANLRLVQPAVLVG